MPNKVEIDVIVPNKNVVVTLFGDINNETIFEKEDAIENGEALIQIKEGCYYEYKLTDGYSLLPSEIVSQSKVNDSSGRISPNIYVGTLNIDVLDAAKNVCGILKLEVQSVKTTYREDYRHMLEEITEQCHDLILQHSSLVVQNIEPDYFKDPKTAYQRFAFIKSIIDSPEFNDAVHKVISSPVTRWKEDETIKDIRGVKRFNNSAIRQLTSATNRIELPKEHQLKSIIHSIPLKIVLTQKIESVDTPENRFIKHALVTIQAFCSDFRSKLNNNSRLNKEADLLVDKLEQLLGHSLFKEISTPESLLLNSPVLQRKEGYREIFRVWLMFDLAAKLIWHGGEDVYAGNKRDVAVLYEYWLFFKLLAIIKEVFRIEPKSLGDLIKETDDGLGLQLQQGIHTPIRGIYNSGSRKLNVEFSYNKTFTGEKSYPASGSWTKTLRPDYTLSIWPDGIDADTAEEEELITHIHFDAKYKVENITGIVGRDEEFTDEKENERRGVFKRADLLKMHAYKDAIRRTSGAYVLYPGDENEKPYSKIGFHELIPGLGAFAIKPSRTNSGIDALKQFLDDVVSHFMNRASQREKISLKTYETYKDNLSNELHEPLPETFGVNRNLIPDETYVLVGYYEKDKWEWIKNKGLYNARAGDRRGSLKLGPKEAGAKYLLLHSKEETITGKLLQIIEIGPRVFSKQTLIDKGYPSKPDDDNYYIVYKVEEVKEKEFLNKTWDITKLGGYTKNFGSAFPFAVTLTELMQVLKKVRLTGT